MAGFLKLLLRRWLCECKLPSGLQPQSPHMCSCGIWWIVWGGRWLPVQERVVDKLLEQQVHGAFARGEVPRA